MLRRLLPFIAAAAPISLGIVWLWAGIPKALDLFSSELAVRAYLILPEGLAHYVGYGLPFIEIVLGFFLLCGIALRTCAGVSIALLTIYIAGIISVWARGMRIHCGCFSKGGPAASVHWTDYALDLARDSLFIAIAFVILLWPISWLHYLLQKTDQHKPAQDLGSQPILTGKLNLEGLDLSHLVPLTGRSESQTYGGHFRGKNNHNG